MSKTDLKAKYGQSLKTKALYNKAIRSECPGGNDLLDLLELVSAMRGRATSAEEASKLVTIEDRLQAIKERMYIDVRNRWEVLE